jgi:hypothetical protein
MLSTKFPVRPHDYRGPRPHAHRYPQLDYLDDSVRTEVYALSAVCQNISLLLNKDQADRTAFL